MARGAVASSGRGNGIRRRSGGYRGAKEIEGERWRVGGECVERGVE